MKIRNILLWMIVLANSSCGNPVNPVNLNKDLKNAEDDRNELHTANENLENTSLRFKRYLNNMYVTEGNTWFIAQIPTTRIEAQNLCLEADYDLPTSQELEEFDSQVIATNPEWQSESGSVLSKITAAVIFAKDGEDSGRKVAVCTRKRN